MTNSAKLRQIIQDFRISHAACEKSCPYFELCPGGYNLIKYKRFGTFDVAETPECQIEVKAFSKALLDHIDSHLDANSPNEQGEPAIV